MSALISIFAVYSFIFLGFLAKKIFKDEIDERTLILISLYFLQPMLTFWGLNKTPINYDLIYAPFVYFVIITVCLFLFYFVSKLLFKDITDQSIFIATSLIGNTSNLGIPLGIALFGESSIAYTSIINIANIFFIYTVEIYLFARENFTIKQSLISMAKIPILWIAFVALWFNYMNFHIEVNIQKALQMGAYATIVVQLMIFGIYLSKIHPKTIDYKLSLSISIAKLIVLPIIGINIAIFMGLSAEVTKILAMSLAVPLAVNNVNIASLYNCKPYAVTASVLISSILFLFIFYFDTIFLGIK